MKIAFFELKDWEKKYFEDSLREKAELVFFEYPLHSENVSIVADCDILVTFIYSQVTRSVLEKLPNLKLIVSMSTGVDHIDMSACKEKNVKVANIPTYGENTVAEHTFALILAIARRLVESVDRVRRGEFSPEGLTGFDIAGKTIGVIGVGNIGEHVVRIANGFGMNVLAYKRNPDPSLAQRLGCTFVDLNMLLMQSDIITLHIPYVKENHHFLNEEKFNHMKQGVIIINTARGGLIDTKALLQAIDSGKVKAAGLDVLEEEPLLKEEKELLAKQFNQDELMRTIQNHMLLRNPYVLITPHNAFNSMEALERIVKVTSENIHGFLNDSPMNLL